MQEALFERAFHMGSMALGFAGSSPLHWTRSRRPVAPTYGSGRKRGASRARSEPKASEVNEK